MRNPFRGLGGRARRLGWEFQWDNNRGVLECVHPEHGSFVLAEICDSSDSVPGLYNRTRIGKAIVAALMAGSLWKSSKAKDEEPGRTARIEVDLDP